MNDGIKSVYLIAICGTGMTALAGLLKEKGYAVSGSDMNVYPPMSTFLAESGISVHSGYDEAHLDPAPDLVVIGNSMSRGNPEVEAVLDRKLNYISLPFALREFFIRSSYSCVVAGTHGKTTTSSLLAWVLESAGRDPGFFIGGIPENFGRGFKVGDGKYFVSEGDEYDSAFFDKGSKFLHYLPDLVILNNIEFDHADIFGSLDEIKVAFRRLINQIPRSGHLVSCWDDPIVRELSQNTFSGLTTFGLADGATWRARSLSYTETGMEFDVLQGPDVFARVRPQLHGEHMVRNCLAVTASCAAMGLTADEIRQGLQSFKNVRRRMQFKGEVNGAKVFDDFAHHPTEIKATLDAVRARYPDARIFALFEPRTATSKRRIFETQFVEALSVADHVVLTPLYAEEKVPQNERLPLQQVVVEIEQKGVPCKVLLADDDMLRYLREQIAPGDVVVFMSNGDFNQIPLKILNIT